MKVNGFDWLSSHSNAILWLVVAGSESFWLVVQSQ